MAEQQSEWEREFPELFRELSTAVRRRVVQNLGLHRQSGIEATRTDVADLIALATGKITSTDYVESVRRRNQQPPISPPDA